MRCAILQRHKNFYQKGFTLLEMMLALAILAGMSTAGIYLLQGVMKNAERAQVTGTALLAIQKTMILLEQDLSHMVIRKKVSTEAALNHSDFVLQAEGCENCVSALILRGNKANPGGYLPHSTLQWVKWTVEQGKLIRITRPFGILSQNGSLERQKIMLSDVGYFSMTILPEKDQKTLAGGGLSTPPRAVKVKIETPGFGIIERIFLLSEIL